MKKSATTTTAETVAPTTATPTSAQIALPYFQALSYQTTAGFETMKALSVSQDAPAWNFAYHQERVFQAKNVYETAGDFYTAQLDGNEILLCSNSDCTRRTRFSEFDLNYKQVWAFSVNGTRLGDALTVWPGDNAAYSCYWFDWSKSCFSPSAYIITVRSMYWLPTGDLQITFDSLRGKSSTEAVEDDIASVEGARTSSSYAMVGDVRSPVVDWVNHIPEIGSTTIGTATFRNVPSGDVTIVINLLLNGERKPFTFKFTHS